jgi:hypothetical protein
LKTSFDVGAHGVEVRGLEFKVCWDGSIRQGVVVGPGKRMAMVYGLRLVGTAKAGGVI